MPEQPPAGWTVRAATAEDLPSLVALLADDALGSSRERPDRPAPYREAFDRIAADPHQRLVVGCREHDEKRPLGTLQLTLTPGLARQGATRGTIEAVRVAREARGGGLGRVLVRWAVDEAARQGCTLVQLTSDATREDAHRFYERLGFRATHVGYKLPLD
ncbi:GNAT family N-acetyltransferase [Streptomyces xiaopingdaonensis]|uniref:GNAT family N-acetyltransferase n=1 Tax=Streptomyces xiaopingdaonensis TaxID=1565415 RepID=UPI0002EC4C77|nr:GNAT family N-acetyltransferase [Streptomyces xiaopingdaonensis]